LLNLLDGDKLETSFTVEGASIADLSPMGLVLDSLGELVGVFFVARDLPRTET